MLRHLQSYVGKNIDSMCTAEVAMKRGMVVTKDHATKQVSLATGTKKVYFVDRGLVNDPLLDFMGTLSEYEDVLENIKVGEFVNLEPVQTGERYATDAFDGIDADFAPGTYLTVVAGKFKKAAVDEETQFESIGFVDDNGHKLLGVEIVD